MRVEMANFEDLKEIPEEKTQENKNSKIKKIFKKIGIIIWEIVYYGALFCGGIIWDYDGISEPATPLWLVLTIFIAFIFTHKSIEKSYKAWEGKAVSDIFYERFIFEYKMPLLFPRILFLFVFVKYFSIEWVIIYYLFLMVMDTWDRRYWTTDIKQDLILKKLNKIK
jgi:sterol desaturase/sphingolipid hydroxylase (fatty acid hydroxylase superfamily)